MNIWQGTFPHTNTAEDGWIGTAPVDAFEPNAYGIYNMTGNVWEWVADNVEESSVTRRTLRQPTVPTSAETRIQRGGSFLCHVSYCDRYHVHSRTRNDPDTSASNSGFRVAAPTD